MSGAALGSASWMRVKSSAHPAEAALLMDNIDDTTSIKIRMMVSRARDPCHSAAMCADPLSREMH
jgi:hypothetical protein